MEPVSVEARLQLRKGTAARVGVDRVRLLEAVGREGSIAAAAKAVGLSYRGAWDAVQALNDLFGRPLVQAQVGGREGGAALVTPAGEALILAFQRIEQELAHVVGQLQIHLADGEEPIDRLAWRLGMKTSARNQLPGVVERVTPGPVNTEVVIRVAEAVSVVAVVTRESAEELELAPGLKAVALIKSTFVILAPGGAPLRTSARNSFVGRVVEHRVGQVSDEVVLEIEGRLRVTATVTRESGEALELKVGDAAQALVKASHVIVAVE